MGNHSEKDVEPGVYMLVDDGSDEFESTLEFAARVARADKARLGIIHILDRNDFMHWGGIESMMEKEIRQEAEQRLWNTAQKVNEFSGSIPALFLEEGNPKEVIPRVCAECPEIKRLVLGASTHGSGPGPLVSYFTGKGVADIHVPITIVPDNIDIDELLRRI